MAENNRNCGRDHTNTSGYKGVYWYEDRKKWRAQIGYQGKVTNLGSFDTPEEAHAAYCEAAHRLHGEFARTE
jgi:hypothetical protein